MAWTDPRTGATWTDAHGPDWQYPAGGPPPPPPPPPPAPAPPNKWTPWLAFGTALVVAGALGFAAVSLTTDDDDPRSMITPSNPQVPSTQAPSFNPLPTMPPLTPGTLTPGTASPPTAPPTTIAPVPDEAALRRIVVTQPDVGSDYTVDLIPGGDLTGDQVTLDLCDGVFPSEALRTARRQVAADDSQFLRRFSTEAVLYENAAAAQQALRELTQARANCPSFPRVTPNGEFLETTFNVSPDASWPPVPGITRHAYDYVNRDLILSEERHNAAVYLVRGRALLALYFFNIDNPQIPVRGETGLAEITNRFERRLAALPERVVADP